LSLPSSPGSEDVAFAGFVTVVKPYKRSSCRDVFAIVDGDTYVCSMLLKEQPVRVGDELRGTKRCRTQASSGAPTCGEPWLSTP
jgi:hypothetical protein